MNNSALSDGEVKARLAQAEVHFSHYRWDDAIALFETVLAARPDHPAAAQGWASAVEQKSIDDDLAQALAKVRASLAADRFEEALATLNQAQTRGALSHILKYHSEIDGLRSEAQEGQEWQRRIEAAGREVETLAGRRRFDQALEVLDNTLRPLSGRGWERLGAGLAALRERLWAERDVSERIQFAQAAFERQDYRLATELAANLHEELPDRDDVRRLHERARGAWGRIEDQLAAVNEALGRERGDDALALLAALRSEHPRNPDWQAIALRVNTNQGREDMAAGRAAMVGHAFEDAAEAFERANAAFTSTVEIFPEHPTAPSEQSEAAALRDAALFASQAVRDRSAFRWEASRQGWQASRGHLDRAIAVRGRDFGEVVAVVDAMLGEAQASLLDLEQGRLMLAEGRELLEARDAGGARESFRAGLSRVEGGAWGDGSEAAQLREQLAAGLRESERGQREVKKLLGQAEAAHGDERLALLQRAYERWETAPGLPARLADALLTAAGHSLEAGNEEGALDFCEQVREVSGAPAGALTAAEDMSRTIRARRQVRSALAEARAAFQNAGSGDLPSPEGFSQALDTLSKVAPALALAKELAPELEALRGHSEEGRSRALAAKAHAAESEAFAAAGDWQKAAEALAAAEAALGQPARGNLAARLAQLWKWAAALENALRPAVDGLRRAEAIYAMAADGDLAAIDFDVLEQTLAEVRKALRPSPELPPTLPVAWEETCARAELLSRRSQVLRGAHEKVAAGRGVEVIPALQADAAAGSDPVILAVLSRVLQETAGDAIVVARGWLAEAAGALNRGEFAAAEASLTLAQSYVAAAPQVIPEIRRVGRQLSNVAQIRAAASAARKRAAEGDMDGALAGYRQALEVATDGETGVSGDMRRVLNQVLDLEDELAGPAMSADAQRGVESGLVRGGRLVESLLDGNVSEPLIREFVAPVLLRWWKLACRAASLASVEAQMSLKRDAQALEAAAVLVERYPRDRAVLDMYEGAARQAHGRSLARLGHRLARAQKLAASGAFAEALAQLELAPHAAAPVPDAATIPDVESAENAETADETADLRAELRTIRALAERLTPLLEQMRDRGLAGDFDKALAARSQAEFIDPRHRASAVWDELDALNALIADRLKGHEVSETLPRNTQGHAVQSRPPAEKAPTRSEAASHARSREPVTQVPVLSSPPPSPPLESEASSRLPSPKASPETSELTPAVRRVPLAGEASGRFPAPDAGRAAEDASTPAMIETEEVAPAAEVRAVEDAEPPAPFDLDDWLSNVTELSPEDGDL